MKSHLLALLACLLAACGVSHGASVEAERTPPPRVRVRLGVAETGDVTQALELTGNLVPHRRTTVVSEMDGVIRTIAQGDRKVLGADGAWRETELALGLGQSVNQGDVLVEIDPKDYELARAAAQTALDAAQADLAVLKAWQRPEEVRRLRALRDQAAARVDLAKLELARVEELREGKVVSESEYDQARSAHAVAKAVLDGAEAALEVAQNGPTAEEVARAQARIAQAEAQVALAQDRLERTKIRAPFDGVITERYVDVGERVTAMPRVEILEIMDLDIVFVEVGIPERHVHEVAIGDVVSLKAEGLEQPVSGSVVLVNDKIDRASRTYRVRVAVVNEDRTLKPGQFVRVSFALRSAEARVLVPREAVTYGGGQPQVFVCPGDRVALRDVRLGLGDDRRVEIVEGIEAGEKVVIDDPAVLSDGMQVEVREGTAP